MASTTYTPAERLAIVAAYRAMWDAVECSSSGAFNRMHEAEKHERRNRRSPLSAKALLVECFAEGVADEREARGRTPADIGGYALGLLIAWTVGGEVARVDASCTRSETSPRRILREDWPALVVAAKAAHQAAIHRAFERIRPA